MKNKKLWIIIITMIVLLTGGILGFYLTRGTKISDAKKFQQEYETVDENNVFVYRTMDEIIKILEHGTGVVYLGFPECPWCKAYVTYLNEVALQNGIEEVYYHNVLNDRKENTKEYQKVVSILNDYLQYDEEGNKRLYVPAVIVADHGNIIGFDDETAWDTKGYETPEEYWKHEDLAGLKKKLGNLFQQISNTTCTSGCNR